MVACVGLAPAVVLADELGWSAHCTGKANLHEQYDGKKHFHVVCGYLLCSYTLVVDSDSSSKTREIPL